MSAAKAQITIESPQVFPLMCEGNFCPHLSSMHLPILSYIDINSPWFAVAWFLGLVGVLFGMAFLLKLLLRKLGINPDRTVGAKAGAQPPVKAANPSFPPLVQGRWNLAAGGIAAVGVGGWVELGGRLEPHFIRMLERVQNHAPDSSPDPGWNDLVALAGSLTRLVGLAYCAPLALQEKAWKLLGAAMGLELVFFLGRLLAVSALFHLHDAKGLDRGTLTAINAGLAFAWNYASAIFFVYFIRKILRTWNDPYVVTYKDDGIRVPAILIGAALVQVLLTATPFLEIFVPVLPKDRSAVTVILYLVLAIPVGSLLVRLGWLYVFGQLLWGYRKAIRRVVA